MRMKTQLHEGGKRKGKGMVEDGCFVRWILFVGKGGEELYSNRVSRWESVAPLQGRVVAVTDLWWKKLNF